MKPTLWLFIAASFAWGQRTGVAMHGADVTQNAAATNGGYFHFAPVSYNPYNGGTCHDLWTNLVQQPLTTGNLSAPGTNDLYLWNSLSPSMPFTGPFTFPDGGLVQGMKFNTAGAAGPCGIPLNVNALYGLNTNGYFFGRAGLATDAWFFNSIQSLQGGVLANSATMGVWYPTGTTVCTAYNGTTCTA